MTVDWTTASVTIDEEYSKNKILNALKSREFNIIPFKDLKFAENSLYLLFLEYEDINWSIVQKNSNVYVNAYPFRKGLIRKAQNASCISQLTAKYPSKLIKSFFPETYSFEMVHPDYVDELMNECYEVRESLMANEQKDVPEVWIMKPSLANRGDGIFLITSMEQLEDILMNIEESDEEGVDPKYQGLKDLKEWIFQKYISKPLLLSCGRKFHIRTYVLAVGNLKALVYKECLVLFAPDKYSVDDLDDSRKHLTNTCLHSQQQPSQQVLRFSPDLHKNLSNTFDSIKTLVSEVIEAAHNQPSNFYALKNCFELYGFDFVIDESGNPWFIEANAFPDFKQTGDELGFIIENLFKDVVDIIIGQESLGFDLVYNKQVLI